jgi:hypothetical protein
MKKDWVLEIHLLKAASSKGEREEELAGGERKLDSIDQFREVVCVTRDGPGSIVTDGLTTRGNEAHLIGRK